MPDFDIQQLRYFAETAKTGSMSQAAKNLFVSQQALSKGIAALEAELGAELFTRTKKGVELTRFGAFFRSRAKLVLAAEEFAQNSYRDFSAGMHRTVALGMVTECTQDFGGTLSPAKLYALQKESPRVSYEFLEMAPSAIRSGLKDGSLQFGIGVDFDENLYESRFLDDFPLVVLVSTTNPLARKPAVTFADLACGKIAVPADDGDYVDMLARVIGTAGAKPATLPIKINPVDGAELIVDDDVFVIKPEQHARKTTSLDHVVIVPLVDAHGRRITVPLKIQWRKSLELGEAERLLIDYIVELYTTRSEA